MSLRRALDRFWFLVDSELVVLFQYVFGTLFILAGLYGIFVANEEPPLTLRGSMSDFDIRVWYWLNVLGPLTSLAGKLMKGRSTYRGMWMQLIGDLALLLALLAYVSGTVQVESWGKGAYGAFLGTGFCIAAVLCVTRDVRRLRVVEYLK